MKPESAMPGSWTICVNGRNYGPYTVEQMRAFAAEGRLAAHSLVARSDTKAYGPASEDPELKALFQVAAPARPTFFTADGDTGTQSFGRHEEEGKGERAHYVIIADMKSRSISGLEEEIFNFGPAFAILPQAWVVSSETSINAIRSALVQKLGKLDILFIADATHDKAAWFNFGPEAESRIRRIWQKSPDQSALSRAG